MKFPVLWLTSVSLSVWVGTEKGVRLACDLVSRLRITLHFSAKAVKPKPKPDTNLLGQKLKGAYIVHFTAQKNMKNCKKSNHFKIL